MIKKLLLGVFTLMICSMSISAQNPAALCGSSHPEYAQLISDRALEVREMMNNGLAITRDDITWIPVKYHLISNAAGTTFPKESNILGLHCKLNEEYEDIDIQFYMNDGFNYIQSDVAYANPGDSQITLNVHKVNDAINVYIGQNANPPNGGIDGGVTLGYFSPQNDWLVIKKSEATYSASTLAHEVGHFLSLPHPFNGWDCTWWDEWKDENPGAECAPMTAPCSNVEVELQDGSNCATAGDFLCDTPPDYNFGFTNNGCNYNGSGCDWNGQQCEPMENNHMGYFGGCADYVFTPQQAEQMFADINSPQRAFLGFDGGPWSTQKITAAPTKVAPSQDATVATFNGVEFDWTDVPNAQRYLLQVALNNSFSLQLEEFVDWQSGSYVSNLSSNTTYYWRVKAFNEYSSCADWSSTGTFVTGSASTGVSTIPTVSDWVIAPNPAQKDSNLSLQLQTSSDFVATVEVVSVSGQVMKSLTNQNFSVGQNTIEVSTNNLARGLYFVTVRSEEGVLNKKVIISE